MNCILNKKSGLGDPLNLLKLSFFKFTLAKFNKQTQFVRPTFISRIPFESLVLVEFLNAMMVFSLYVEIYSIVIQISQILSWVVLLSIS